MDETFYADRKDGEIPLNQRQGKQGRLAKMVDSPAKKVGAIIMIILALIGWQAYVKPALKRAGFTHRVLLPGSLPERQTSGVIPIPLYDGSRPGEWSKTVMIDTVNGENIFFGSTTYFEGEILVNGSRIEKLVLSEDRAKNKIPRLIGGQIASIAFRATKMLVDAEPEIVYRLARGENPPPNWYNQALLAR